MTTLVQKSNIVSLFDELRQSCLVISSRLDKWTSQKKQIISEHTAEHKAFQHDTKTKQTLLMNRIRELKEHMENLTNQQQRETEAKEELVKDIDALTKSKTDQTDQIFQLQAKIREMTQVNVLKRRALDESKKRQAVESLKASPRWTAYQERLGFDIIRPEGDSELLKFVFTHINEKDWNEEHFFVIDVSGKEYKGILFSIM